MSLGLRWWVGLVAVSGAFGLARVLSACSGDSTDTQDASQDNTVSCGTGLTLCQGTCSATNTDPVNCGACGTKCASGQKCAGGQCLQTCGGGSAICGDACADLVGDPKNCGGCGTTCQSGFVCNDGGCSLSCQTGYTKCPDDAGDTICIDPQTNDYNCGTPTSACGNVCASGTRCEGGVCGITCQTGLSACLVPAPDAGDSGAQINRCIDLIVDPQNCGSCGNACEGGTFCSPTDDAGDASCGLGCFGGSLLCTNRCVDPKIDPYNCGGCNKACDGGQTCVDAGCK